MSMKILSEAVNKRNLHIRICEKKYTHTNMYSKN